MPKRTNEFQQLVTLVHKAIAPQGARITESALVKAPHFGDLGEIDVLLESDIGPYRMKIAIEAKDHRRRLNVTEIEAIIGKYRCSGGLIVDRVVLVSRHGSSNQASEKAKLNGITLLTLSEAEALTGTSSCLLIPNAFPPPHILSFDWTSSLMWPTLN